MSEKAILIGLITPKLTQDQVDEYLEELSFLAKTAGVNPVKDLHRNYQIQITLPFLEKEKSMRLKSM